MKVSKCDDLSTPTKTLSWNEMVKQEGVYRTTNGTSVRFIVLHSDTMCSVLFYNPPYLQPTISRENAGRKFIRTNEQVCFEVK